MKKAQRLLAICISLLLLAGLLNGCSSNKGDEDKASTPTTAALDAGGANTDRNETGKLDTSKPAEIVLYVIGSEAPGQPAVSENFNKMALEKFNCTLKINYVGWADYATKYPLLFSSGEEFDLAYTATWLNFSALAQKGAFMNLDKLWPAYAPDNFALQSKTALDQATAAGHYYCIPTLFATYSAYGPIYRTDLMEGLNWSGKMDNFADMEEYLQLVKDNHAGIEPIDIFSGGSNLDDLYLYYDKMYPITGSTENFLYIDPSSQAPKLFTFYEYGKITDFLTMMKQWNDKGFFSKSALSDTDNVKTENGKAALKVHNMDTYSGYYVSHPEWGFKFSNFAKDVSNLSFTQDALVVSNTSKNPERALALYNWITTDEEAFRAFYYGIAGENYEITGEGQLKMLDLEKFGGSSLWAARTSEFQLDSVGSPVDIKDLKESFDQQIVDGQGAQKYRSFVFDTSSVETEYAACQSVHQQYWWPLELGYVDLEAGLAEYQSKLEAAGIEKVRNAIQIQLDEYITNLD